MRYRFLGRTGLLVSELGLGTNTFGGGQDSRWKAFGALDRQGVGAVIGAALDAGVNLIDLADTYGDGESEARVGEALQDLGVARDQVILTDKACLRTGPGPNAVGLSRAHVMDSVETSLRKLKTDYLDIFQLHNFDAATPIEETLEALEILVRQGKVRYVGCSNFTAWQVAVARGVAEARRLPRIEAVEANYTVAARVIERELIPFLSHQGVGLLVWGPLGAGLLTGKYDRQGGGPEGARLVSGGSTIANRERALDAVDVMRPIAAAHGASVGQVALAWLLAKPAVSSVIVGCKSPEQLRDNLAAMALTLTPEDMASLDAVAALPAEYPMTTQASAAANRLPKTA
jgi:aryl-alcohol dehydrogenase-like predicted oxidoreductase